MNRSVLAGLGNLLSDEVLWRARIHPRAPDHDLHADAVRALHGATRRTLRTSVRAERVTPRHSWLTGRGGDGASRPPPGSGAVVGWKRPSSRGRSGRSGGRRRPLRKEALRATR
nr:hypothetical protein [Streptomyces sp. EN23]